MSENDILDLYNQGYHTLWVTLIDNSTLKLRLFISSQGRLCYLAKGRSQSGYPISHVSNRIKAIDKKKKALTVFEKYVDNLQKFKKAFTQKLHPNLWKNLRNGYNKLDIDNFIEFIGNRELKSSYDGYLILLDYADKNNLNSQLNFENHYKTTTIKSNKPKGYLDKVQYNRCLENIGDHLDNKENFEYHWRSNYDVSVSGKLCDDGIYRAWLSLEYYNMGNGHYYLLINENQAVFCEDD